MVIESQEKQNDNDNVNMVLESQEYKDVLESQEYKEKYLNSKDPTTLYYEMQKILTLNGLSQNSSSAELEKKNLIEFVIFIKYAETLKAHKKNGGFFKNLKTYFTYATKNNTIEKNESLKDVIGANRVVNILETKNLKKANV